MKLYEINVHFGECTYKGVRFIDIKAPLLYTGKRHIDAKTIKTYYKDYDKLTSEDKARIQTSVDESFTQEEVDEIINSGFLNKFMHYSINELDFEKEAENRRQFYKEKGIEIPEYEQNRLPVYTGILALGVGGPTDVLMYEKELSFPVGAYVSVENGSARENKEA